MEIVKLPITKREKMGSAESRRLRRAGRIPGVLYGLGRDPISLSVDGHLFDREFHRGQRMFNLNLDGKSQICLLKELHLNALGDRVLHLDLVRVDESKPVTVFVALEFVGIPVPVTGAVVDTIRSDVSIVSLPKDIPVKIEVPIGHLVPGSQIVASDLVLPEGVTLDTDARATLLSYHFKHIEAEAPEEAAELVVLTERKPTEKD